MCGTARLGSLLALAAMVSLPAVVEAQFTYTTNNGSITITRYTGTGGAVTISNTINGLPVTRIGDSAFFECTNLTDVTVGDGVTSIEYRAFWACSSLTNITIPDSVSSIGWYAFGGCSNLPSIRIPNSVTSIGNGAFYWCSRLTSLAIPNCVTSIGDGAFGQCSSLMNVMIPESVTSIRDYTFYLCTGLSSLTIPHSVISIGDYALNGCSNLTAIYITGDAPSLGGPSVFASSPTTIYYLPNTTGWDTFAYSATILWNPQVLSSDGNFGVGTNGFGFTFTNGGSPTVVVEACTNLLNPDWSPLATQTLTGGSSCFGDVGWSNHPARFYRFSLP